MTSARSKSSKKERLNWTPELHDQFEDAVNHLGGPDRATPKGILKAMAVPGLSIKHVKSHLQKFRISKYIFESTTRHKIERSTSEVRPNFGAICETQLKEALQMHKEAQMRLNDQIEVHMSLKLKMEAQQRFLQKFTEKHVDFSIESLRCLQNGYEFNAKEKTEVVVFEEEEDQSLKKQRLELDEDGDGFSPRSSLSWLDQELFSDHVMPLVDEPIPPYHFNDFCSSWNFVSSLQLLAHTITRNLVSNNVGAKSSMTFTKLSIKGVSSCTTTSKIIELRHCK